MGSSIGKTAGEELGDGLERHGAHLSAAAGQLGSAVVRSAAHVEEMGKHVGDGLSSGLQQHGAHLSQAARGLGADALNSSRHVEQMGRHIGDGMNIGLHRHGGHLRGAAKEFGAEAVAAASQINEGARAHGNGIAFAGACVRDGMGAVALGAHEVSMTINNASAQAERLGCMLSAHCERAAQMFCLGSFVLCVVASHGSSLLYILSGAALPLGWSACRQPPARRLEDEESPPPPPAPLSLHRHAHTHPHTHKRTLR